MENKSNNTFKREKLLKITIMRIVILTWVLATGICCVVSYIIRHEKIKVYEDFAASYSHIVAKNISGDEIEKYIKSGETDERYFELQGILQGMVDVADLRYLYIYIPVEEGVKYVFDAQSDDDSRPLNDIWYLEGTFPIDEAFEAYKEGGEVFTRYQYDDMNLAAYITPVYNSSGEIVALAEADVIMPQMMFFFPESLVSIIVFVVLIMVVAMSVFIISTKKRIINPLSRINKAALEIIENIESDEEVDIDVHTGDEIEELAESIETMSVTLKEYLRENEEISAEKERVNTELNLATKIQVDVLPREFPAFPNRSEFNIYASMTPAKEVGGDFYDFFLVDYNHLAMVMADVSGKGVPAAMFMMMAKTMLQTKIISGKYKPSEVLEDVNNLICGNNKEKMFVTVWLGILDITTGILTASNAGHEYPFIAEPGGGFEVFKDKHGFVLGGKRNLKYKDYTVNLKPGSKVFVYTDGVPEANNADNKRFEMDRTKEALNKAAHKSPEDVLKEVENNVKLFSGEAEQFDDLTMLCLEYLGAENTDESIEYEEKTVPAVVDNIAVVQKFVENKLNIVGCAMSDKKKIDVAIDELFANISNYAYKDGVGDVSVGVRIDVKELAVYITFKDGGVPFNPMELEEPDVTLGAKARHIGGLGIYIVKNTMDDVSYEYTDGKNVLTIKKIVGKIK